MFIVSKRAVTVTKASDYLNMSSAKAILKSLRIKIFRPQLHAANKMLRQSILVNLDTGILNLVEVRFSAQSRLLNDWWKKQANWKKLIFIFLQNLVNLNNKKKLYLLLISYFLRHILRERANKIFFRAKKIQ